eukprot:5613261-Prymnesium_polylepis.3
MGVSCGSAAPLEGIRLRVCFAIASRYCSAIPPNAFELCGVPRDVSRSRVSFALRYGRYRTSEPAAHDPAECRASRSMLVNNRTVVFSAQVVHIQLCGLCPQLRVWRCGETERRDLL